MIVRRSHDARVILRASLVLTTFVGAGACVFAPPPSFRPGELTRVQDGGPSPNARRVGECLEIAVSRVASREVERDGRVLLAVRLGNACDRSVRVDLRGLRVTGTCGERAHAQLEAFDPRREIGPGRLAPFGSGGDRIAYGSRTCREEPRAVCVNVAHVMLPDQAAYALLDPTEMDPTTTICMPDDALDAGAGANPASRANPANSANPASPANPANPADQGAP